MRKNLIISIGVFILLGISIFVIKNPTDKNEKNISSNISNGYKIVDKDLNTEIVLPYKDVSSYASVNDDLYLSVADNSPSRMGNKVIKFNRKSKKAETIFETKFDQSSVQGVVANDKWLSWVDSDDLGDQVNIYAMNLKNRKIISITKENDKSVSNGFPTVSGDYISWVSHEVNTNKSYVMLRNLKEKNNEKISEVKNHSWQNDMVSMMDNNLLFTDSNDKKWYLYIYDIAEKKKKKIETKSKNIGWSKLLNDHQVVYLTFAKDTDFMNQLILHDIKNNFEKKLSGDKYINIGDITLDDKNNVFVSENEGFKQYKINENSINENSFTKKDVLDYKDVFKIVVSNGVYLIVTEDSKLNNGLIITSKI